MVEIQVDTRWENAARTAASARQCAVRTSRYYISSTAAAFVRSAPRFGARQRTGRRPSEDPLTVRGDPTVYDRARAAARGKRRATATESAGSTRLATPRRYASKDPAHRRVRCFRTRSFRARAIEASRARSPNPAMRTENERSDRLRRSFERSRCRDCRRRRKRRTRLVISSWTHGAIVSLPSSTAAYRHEPSRPDEHPIAALGIASPKPRRALRNADRDVRLRHP